MAIRNGPFVGPMLAWNEATRWRHLRALVRSFGDRSTPWSWRVDGLMVMTLALLVVVTRWPYRARRLTFWDSIWFALGLEQYDVSASQPHPPGYPLFIGLARILFVVLPDANRALVLLSILFSVLAIVLLYGLARSWASRRVALAAGLLFGLSPVFRFNGVVALSYTSDAAAAVGVALLAWRARASPTGGRSIGLGAAWGVAVGLRPNNLIFLTPLLVYGLLAGARTRAVVARRFVRAGAAGLATVLLWLVPMLFATPGGIGAWWQANSLQSRNVVFADTVFTGGMAAFQDHADRLALYLDAEVTLLPALMVLLGLAILLGKQPRRKPKRAFPFETRTIMTFLAIWLLPSLLFYLLVFDGLGAGPNGYALTLLPGVYVTYGLTGDACLRRLERTTKADANLMAGWVALPLLLLPGIAIAGDFRPAWEQEVRQHDAWAAAWDKMREQFPPNETAILTWYNWAHAKWYFQDYIVWTYLPIDGGTGPDWVLTLQTKGHRDDRPIYPARSQGRAAPEHPIPKDVQKVVLFDFQLAGENGGVNRLTDEAEVEEVVLSNGWRVLYFGVAPGRTIESYFRYLPDAAHLTDDFRL